MTKPSLAGIAAVSIALATSASVAFAAGPKFHSCRNARYAPQFLTITHIFQAGTSCAVAHGVALGYENAVTQSFTSKGGRTGVCFGAHSYGNCTFRYAHQSWHCFHFNAVPARTRGLVRCTQAVRRVSFNIRT
jgi:hypothetical protein